MTRSFRSLLLTFAFVGGGTAAWAEPGKNPIIRFIENKNQWRHDIRYSASVRGADVFLLNDRIQFLIRQETTSVPKSRKATQHAVSEGGTQHHPGGWLSAQLYEVSFIDANQNPVIEPSDVSSTSYNYFVGADKGRWASKVKGFGAVTYHELYNDIDLKIYSENERVKQDWIVQPGGDPAAIRIRYDGAESTGLRDGNLAISTRAGDVMEMAPVAWQEIDNCRIPVAVRYKLRRDVVSYDFPEGYDAAYPLIIDPILVFSGYSGSTYDNWGNSATYDEHGNLYSGGMITNTYGGTDFPATPGAYQTRYIGGEWDIGILKYDSSGSSLLYATYVGGNGTESPQSLVVNHAGQLLILGATSSNDFPVSNGSIFKGGQATDPIYGTDYFTGSDIFIARLSEDGSQLLSATYLGGSANDGLNIISGYMSSNFNVQSPLARNYGDQVRGDIITDSDNNVYIASNTLSFDFPVINPDPNAKFNGGPIDAVLVKMAPDLSSIIWSRLLGGSGSDAAYSLKLDSANGIYIAGGTTSPDFKNMTGIHTAFQGRVDGWVAHIAADGQSVLQATYLGTSAYDQAYFIDIDQASDVFVFGQTQGSYPVQGTVYSNSGGGQFLHKLSADLSTSVFSTVVGSGGHSPNISPTAFLVSDCNTIYLGGWGGVINAVEENNGFEVIIRNYVGGNTFGMPVSPNAYQPATQGNDFYFMVLSADASQFLYGTYFGGSASYTHVDGGTSRFDKRGVVYHSVCAGCGGRSDFPAINVPPARRQNRSANCNNAAFKFDLSLLRAEIQTNSLRLNTPGLSSICLADSIVFQNESIGGQLFAWNLGDGYATVKPDTSLIIHHYAKPGTYTVKLKAFDPGTCRAVDSTSVQVIVHAPKGTAGPDPAICAGTLATLTATGGITYQWMSSDSTFKANGSSVQTSPSETTKYIVRIVDSNACSKLDTVVVSVVPSIDVDFSVHRVFDCFSRPWIEVKNLTNAADSSYIDFGDGTTSNKPVDNHTYQKDSAYTVTVRATKSFCSFEKEMMVSIYTINVPNVITPDESPGQNDTFRMLYGDQYTEQSGIKVSVVIYNRWGKEVYSNGDYRGDWSGANLQSGIYYYEATINGETTCKSWIHIIR